MRTDKKGFGNYHEMPFIAKLCGRMLKIKIEMETGYWSNKMDLGLSGLAQSSSRRNRQMGL